MHNTHSLGRTRQLSQMYFTHSLPILTLHNQPSTVNKQWLSLRESRMSSHTRFNTSRKTETAAMLGIFLGKNAVYSSRRPSIPFCILFLLFCKCRNLSYLKCYSRICHREANAILAKPGRACAKISMFPVKPRRGLADFNAESIVSCLRQRDLTGFFLHNYKNMMLLVGAMSMRVEIRDTWVTLLSVNIVFDSCRRQNIWVCNPASRETWPSREITGEPLNSRILVPNRRESTGVLPGALRNWSSRLLRSSTYTGLRNQR